MKKTVFLFLLSLCYVLATAQSVKTGLNNAFKDFLAEAQFKHAVIGLLVIDVNSGEVILSSNSQAGLVPASTQKIITAATAFQLLGKDFRYETKIGYTGNITDGVLQGDIVIKGSGDPTLGSPRYTGTEEQKIINEIIAAILQAGIQKIEGHVLIDETAFENDFIPDGWIWQDIGNYYGAPARALNWRENQFDLYLKSDSHIDAPVEITGTNPPFIPDMRLVSLLRTAGPQTGDNAYIYPPLFGETGYIKGTIPANRQRFSISGSLPEPGKQLAIVIESVLKKLSPEDVWKNYPANASVKTGTLKLIHTIQSPTLDSICYWFLNKSINLYGEALLKTLGQHFGKKGTTEEGIKVIQNFWISQGIDKASFRIFDGSGLSPQNRITPDAMAKALLFARKQPWFDSYYSGFPIIDGIRMKSGTINGVVSYTGFVKGKSGEYIFAFIVNNYDGVASTVRRKMWRLLDILK